MDGRLKDIHRLIRKIDKLTEGQASVDVGSVDWDQTNIESFLLIIRPNGGYYKGGKFEFRVNLPFDYPSACPPVVWCNTMLYHPNIDMEEEAYDESSTNVCLNLLDYGYWQESYTLEVMVLGLLFLFHHPNLDDPLASGFRGLETEAEFAENVRKYMAGEDVDGVKYKTDFRVINGILVEEGILNKRETVDKEEPEPILEFEQEAGLENMEYNNKETSGKQDQYEKQPETTVIDTLNSSNNGGFHCDTIKATENNYTTNAKNIIHSQISIKSQQYGDFIMSGNTRKGEVDIPKEHLETDADHKRYLSASINEMGDNMMNDKTLNAGFKDSTLPSDDESASDDLHFEFISVDGEYILKPKSIHIEETGSRPKQAKVDDDLMITDEDLSDKFKVKGSRSSILSCLRNVCRFVSRLFRRSR